MLFIFRPIRRDVHVALAGKRSLSAISPTFPAWASTSVMVIVPSKLPRSRAFLQLTLGMSCHSQVWTVPQNDPGMQFACVQHGH